MSKFLEGKKTYAGLAVALVGIFGIANFITPNEAEVAVNSIVELVGIVFAIYGRIQTKPSNQI